MKCVALIAPHVEPRCPRRQPAFGPRDRQRGQGTDDQDRYRQEGQKHDRTGGRWGPISFPGHRTGVPLPLLVISGLATQDNGLRFLSRRCQHFCPRSGRFVCLNSVFSRHSLDNLRFICSVHGCPAQHAANTSCPRSDSFSLLELRVSRTFLYQLRPSFSGHGHPTQHASNTSCPARPLRPQVSRSHSLSFPGAGFLAASVAFSLANGFPASRVSISFVSFSRMSGL